MPETDLLAVGIDIGATATRVLAVDAAGVVRGRGQAGGANPTAHPPARWTSALSGALDQALSGTAGEVGSVVIGTAGDGALADARTTGTFREIVRSRAGRECRIDLTSDVLIAFAAATPESNGTILVAGTGAAAAAVRDRTVIRTTDGYGWLLGDTGSGYWLGRKAIQAVLAELDGRAPPTALRHHVVDALLGANPPAADPRAVAVALVRAVVARPPVELSVLAPIVSSCAGGGDATAQGIATLAAEHLVAAVEVVREADDSTPLALAGSVAAGDHMTGELLRVRLERAWPHTIRPVGNGVCGAAWLALLELTGVAHDRGANLHRAMFSQAST